MLPGPVRHLHSPEWRKASPKQKIKAYWRALGLPDDLPADQISSQLDSKFPKEFASFREIAAKRAEGVKTDDVYHLKNASLAFSLLIGALFRGAAHCAVMRWVSERPYSPATVLDIGCDNGLLTCFYAFLWPSATVKGVDISNDGIDRARELAALLELTNIDFETQCAENLNACEPDRTYDLIITSTVLEDAGYFESMESDEYFLDEAFDIESQKPGPPAFREIARLLAPDGRWLGAEFLMTPHLLWRWVGALQLAGLSIERESCRRIKCDESLLSILVAGKEVSARVSAGWAINYWTRENLYTPVPIASQPNRIVGGEALAALHRLPQKRRIAVARRWDKGAAESARETERIELFITESLVAIVRARNNMHLQVFVLEIRELDNARNAWEKVAKEFQESGCKFQSHLQQDLTQLSADPIK